MRPASESDPVATALAGLALDHVGIAVPTLEQAAPYLALGLRPSGPDEVVAGQGVVVRLLRAGDAAVELLAPLDDDGPVARFLRRRGPGLHHVAFRVAELATEVARLQAAGAELVDPTPRPGRGGHLVVFLHPRWTGGALVELVEHR